MRSLIVLTALAWGCATPEVSSTVELVAYTHEVRDQADIVLAIDSSCSMEPFYDEVLEVLPTIVGALDATDIDYRIGVLEPFGEFVRAQGTTVVDRRTPDAEAVVQAMLEPRTGTYSAARRLSFYETVLADGGTRILPVPTFYRLGAATLDVVFLTDTADESSRHQLSVEGFLAWMDGVNRVPEATRAHAVVQSGCSPEAVSDDFVRYAEHTGGLTADLCADWRQILHQIVDTRTPVYHLVLPEVPFDLVDVRLFEQDRVLPPDSYELERAVLRVDPDVWPPEGERIVVRYLRGPQGDD